MSTTVVPRMGKQPDLNPSQSRPQATSEQLRLAQIIQDPKKDDNDKLRENVRKIIELTSCSEDHALATLHDCDNDVETAITKVLDGSAGPDEWIVPNTKKSRKAAAAQHAADGEAENESNVEHRISRGKHAQSKQPTNQNGDRPPRFKTDRGVSFANSRGRGRTEGEFVPGGARRERRPGRGQSAGTESADRGRQRGGLHGHRGGGPRTDGSGGMDKIGTWSPNGEVKDSNTWNNSMAKEQQENGTWSGGQEASSGSSNVWDNSMAEHITRRREAPQHPPHSNNPLSAVREDWNNTSTDDFDWTKNQKTLVFNNSKAPHKPPSPSQAVASFASSHPASETNTSPSAHFNRAGENIDVKVLMSQASEPMGKLGINPAAPPGGANGTWNQQATNKLKNELGIGKDAITATSSHSEERGKTKVEMPFEVNVSQMDIHFGFRADTDSSGNNLDYIHSAGLYSQRTPTKLENGSASPAGILGLKESPKVMATSLSQPYAGKASVTSGRSGYGDELNASIPTSDAHIHGSMGLQKQQGALGVNATTAAGGRSVPSSYSIGGGGESTRTQAGSNMGSVSTPNYAGNAQMQSTRNSTGGSSNQTKSNAGIVAGLYGAPMYGVNSGGLSYMNMYSPVATQGVRPDETSMLQQLQMGGFLPGINPPFDMSNMAGIPPISGSSSRDPSNVNFSHSMTGGEMKSLGGNRSEASAVSGAGQIPGPPPGFSVATVSNASAASQLISHTGYTFPPMFSTIPPNYQSMGQVPPQLLMNMGSTSGAGPAQFPKHGNPQANFYQPSYEGEGNQVEYRNYGNSNSQVGKYGNGGGNDKNFGGVGNLNKSNFVDPKFAAATPPPLQGMPQFQNFQAGYGANFGMPMLSPLIPMDGQRGGAGAGKGGGAGKGYGAGTAFWGGSPLN